jgi:hypothetical protein
MNSLYQNILRKSITIIGILVVLSCVTAPGEKEHQNSGYKASKPVPHQKPIDSGLSNPRFKNIPPEAASYLKTLAQAFSAQNIEFIIHQGEPDYERRVKNCFSQVEYLALLYRIGPFAKDSSTDTGKLPVLNIQKVAGISFTDWEEQGPAIIVQGHIINTDGNTLPCCLVILWRFPQPCLLGYEP